MKANVWQKEGVRRTALALFAAVMAAVAIVAAAGHSYQGDQAIPEHGGIGTQQLRANDEGVQEARRLIVYQTTSAA
ncbi:hypothetical protein [Paenibacillus xanthanilyticus]|uniref:Uncharacterized protein n=1 Tax=Paenibacillus xanthanilyticus TaxID=1783531 RepID=A0ABV8K6C5_9BACL